MRAKRLALVSTALIAGLILTGCGADSASDTASSSAGGGPQERQPAMAAPDEAGGAALDKGATQENTQAKAPDLKVDQRSIIYRGSISVRVKDVNAEAAKITGIATTAGGFIGSDNRSSGGSGTDTATMELRIPADKFSSVTDQLSKLGKEENREISTEDVTEATVDLDARIVVQQARVDSGRKLLAQAKSLNDLVMLEREVATRESDLASLQAKKRRLADLTALSTITVSLLGPSAAVVDKPDDSPGFLGGLSGGWKALVASLGVLLAILGALLPWLLVLGLPAWAIFFALRRYRASRATPAVASSGPTPAIEDPDDKP
jgi:hypothetical protein